MESKPPKSSWFVDEKVGQKIEALQAYAVDACSDEQRRLAGNVIYQYSTFQFFHAQLSYLFLRFVYTTCWFVGCP